MIVADGFTGNVVLKLTEGLAGHLFRSLAHKIPKDALNGIMGDLDYSVHGGAPILGVTRPIIKMHGSSGPRAVKSAILKAIDFVETDVVGTIKDQVR